jgi:peptide chain release factor subunit 1
MISDADISSLKDFVSHEGHPVVSVYLNVDGSTHPVKGGYEAEFSAMVANARKAAREELDLSRDQESLLDDELSAIGNYLTLDFRRNGVKGLAVFSCRPENLWQVTGLNIPVENRIHVDWKPQMSPLLETLSGFQRICVLMTSKETARIFQMFAGEVTEHSEILDNVLKHHEQGGWEQAKLQRRHEKQVREHLKNASAATLEYFKQEKFDRLVIGISDDLWPELEKVLHPYLKERLLGRFSAEITAPLDEILPKVKAMEEMEQLQAEAQLLESLGPELESGRTYIGGLDDVLAMLNERRVDLLLVEEGYTEPGRRCEACNTVEFGERVCPACGQSGKNVADVVEEAREIAIRQDARVITVPVGHPAMERAGKIAARLRY